MDNKELMAAIEILEKEKNIDRKFVFEVIENSLLVACKNHFGTNDNARVEINEETGQSKVFLEKTVVDQVENPALEIDLDSAKAVNKKAKVGETVEVEVDSAVFGRIAAQSAKNTVLSKLREEERRVINDEYSALQGTVVTGIVQRYTGRNGKDISIDLGRTDAYLPEKEQVPTEHLRPTDRVKVYICQVGSNNSKNTKITVSRTHPDLVRKLFEEEVSEVRDGIVEIKSIAREAGSRTKIAVWSNDPDVDPVGACVGMNGARVNAIVDALGNEKIDIVNYDEIPAYYIENALSPAKVVAVVADDEDKTARVVVPDYQLSLAIGKEGQNARLAAKLTNFKIDIKSETQAKEAGDFIDFGDEYYDEDGEYYDEYYDENGEYYDEEEYYDDSAEFVDEDDADVAADANEADLDPDAEEAYDILADAANAVAAADEEEEA